MTGKAVYVTGMGVVSCLGSDVREFWQALCAGQCGLGPVTRFDLGGSPCTIGGEVKGFAIRPFEECGLSVGAQFAARAATMALGSFPSQRLPSLAVVLATSFGPAEVFRRELAEVPPARTGFGYCLEMGLFAEDARRVADGVQAGGPLVTVSLSCASGAAAIAYALDLIRSGRAEAALACGYDSIQRMTWAGLAAMGAMALPSDGSAPAVRPFDVNRSGTIFSEGAACLLLESAGSAAERRAEPLAEVSGGASNNRMTHGDEGGEGTATVIRMALNDAGIGPDDVDLIYACGAGTKLNDAIEARAFHTVFGERAGRMPVVSITGAVGHAMGAAGSLEAVAGVMTLQEGTIPPTVGLRSLDPECALDLVRGTPRSAAVATLLSNSAGIGGANAAIVLRKPSLPATEV